jgi:hypothetical protein
VVVAAEDHYPPAAPFPIEWGKARTSNIQMFSKGYAGGTKEAGKEENPKSASEKLPYLDNCEMDW